MLSIRHEALVEILRDRPSLVAELLAGAGFDDFPDGDVELVDSDLTEALPPQLRADVVGVLERRSTEFHARERARMTTVASLGGARSGPTTASATRLATAAP